MHHKKVILIAVLITGTWLTILQAQEAISTSGGNATGIGGTTSFTIGQIVYSSINGINGNIVQGVQQPFEISVVTAIKGTEEILLEILVYPNPTEEFLKLKINGSNQNNLKYLLYDLNGSLLETGKIENVETDINMSGRKPATYFLKIFQARKEIKTFKIIKN